MINFNQCMSSALYVAENNQASGGWWGFVIMNDESDQTQLPATPISLKDALENTTWAGSFVYIASGPYPDTNKNQDEVLKFIAKIKTLSSGGMGVLVFLQNSSLENIDPQTLATFICITRMDGKVKLGGGGPGLQVNLTGVDGVELALDPNSKLSVSSDGTGDFIQIDNSTTPVAKLVGTFPPKQFSASSNSAQLHFAGSQKGALTFSLSIGQSSLYDNTNWGFQFLIPNNDLSKADAGTDQKSAAIYKAGILPYLSAWFPFAHRDDTEQEILRFNAQVNLVNPRNQISEVAQTVFFFTSTPPATLISCFRTCYGKGITLIPVQADTDGQIPAGLVINAGYKLTNLQHGFHFAPTGDFILVVDEAKAGVPQKMLCGLSGTETIAFLPQVDTQAGTRLRFSANCPANVPVFPLKEVSPVGPPIDPDAGLLDSQFVTSWVSFVAPPADQQRAAHYAAAPKGAELFGKTTSAVTGLLGPEDPGLALPSDGSVCFPVLPSAEFAVGDGTQDITADQFSLLSRQVIGPTRKKSIASGKAICSSASAQHTLFHHVTAADNDDNLTNTTTPAGLIARYSDDGSWKQLLLSQVQNSSGGISEQLGFTNLQATLQSAFQTSGQFLVIANNAHLGDPASGVFMQAAATDVVNTNSFYNTISIGNWKFCVQTGTQNTYGDYRSVIIVKGVKGKIFAIDSETNTVSNDSLVLSPDKWTMKETFAAPSVTGTDGSISEPQLSQLIPLSNWLVEYCQDAYARKDNAYFSNFVQIIQDENWTGVLILKAAVAQLPDELAGIAAGVNDKTDFYVHHLGIEIGQIDGQNVVQSDTTSMFGLIYYVDPRYDDTSTPHSIAPNNLNAEYDFTLLTLKTLFENSSVRKFESLAQMTLSKLFGSKVTKMRDVKSDGEEANLYNAVLLEGGIQKNGDAVVYSLSSKWPNRYFLANNILTEVEIDTAEMSTRDDGSTSGQTISWIGMSGFMRFAVISSAEAEKQDESLPAFDIFSFGAEAGQGDTLRTGLNFNNLGLKITVSQNTTSGTSETRLNLIENEISFNTVSSTPREKSLYTNFQLELRSMVFGNAKATDGEKKSDPASLGYLTVATQYGLSGVTSGTGCWHGCIYKLNLGTPGALAGKVNLDSSLLIAWADDSGATEDATSFQAMIGIELPGTGAGGDLFSLQTVIKLSVGVIQLMYVPPEEGNTSKKGGFLLVLNELALKFLGLLKIPPSGNTSFLLFGNPNAADSTGLGWFAMYKKDKNSN